MLGVLHDLTPAIRGGMPERHRPCGAAALGVLLAMALAACGSGTHVEGYVTNANRYPGSVSSQQAEASCRKELSESSRQFTKSDVDACMRTKGWRRAEWEVPGYFGNFGMY